MLTCPSLLFPPYSKLEKSCFIVPSLSSCGVLPYIKDWMLFFSNRTFVPWQLSKEIVILWFSPYQLCLMLFLCSFFCLSWPAPPAKCWIEMDTEKDCIHISISFAFGLPFNEVLIYSLFIESLGVFFFSLMDTGSYPLINPVDLVIRFYLFYRLLDSTH